MEGVEGVVEFADGGFVPNGTVANRHPLGLALHPQPGTHTIELLYA